MSLFELFLIALGLSMDAFAVSICKGLALGSAKKGRAALIVGLYFGLFQAGMPLIGYFLGAQFAQAITAFDHWIAFVLLAFIGGKMIYECLRPGQEEHCDDELAFKRMLPLAVATSIDALAVGVSFAFLTVDIVPAVSFIGAITFGLSFLGVSVGNVLGEKMKSRAEFLGGLILILMGLKILLEHLGILG